VSPNIPNFANDDAASVILLTLDCVQQKMLQKENEFHQQAELMQLCALGRKSMLCNTRSILLWLMMALLAGILMKPGLFVSHNVDACEALWCANLILPSPYLVLFGAGHRALN
jgi:hypothetical protein